MFGTGMHETVAVLLDAFHNSAERSDLKTWCGCFLTEKSRFLGTDVTENWTAGDAFKTFQSHFEQSKCAWKYTPIGSRIIDIEEDGSLATFDERLRSESFGPGVTSRGTGVAVKRGSHWFLLNYYLSFPIPNPLAKQLCETIASHEASTVSDAAADELLKELEGGAKSVKPKSKKKP